jgi:hypothetical protein
MWRTNQAFADAPEAVRVDGFDDRTAPLFTRVAVDLPCVLIELTYGNVIRGRVLNLSLGGMLFGGADSIETGTRVLCALVRGTGEHAEELYAAGTVTHRTAGGVGIAFDEVTPRAFIAIGEMIGEGGNLHLKAIWPRHEAPRRHARPRRARLRAWTDARKAA